MNNRQKLKFAFIFFLNSLFLSVVSAETPPDYYSPENVRKFADFLYEQGTISAPLASINAIFFTDHKKAKRFIIESPSVIALAVRLSKRSKILNHFCRRIPQANIQAESTTRSVRPIF